MLSRFIDPLESRQLLSAVHPAIALKILAPTSTLLSSEYANDLIIDSKRNQLLSVHSNGIQRFDLSDGSEVGFWAIDASLGGFLGNGDITMDGGFAYFADGAYHNLYKGNLENGVFNAIPVAFSFEADGPRELAIRQSQAIVSQWPFNVGRRDFILAINTDDDSVQRLTTTSNEDFSLDQYAILARSADYNTIAFASSNNDYIYNESGITGRSQLNLGTISALAVSRNGALHAIGTSSAVFVEDDQFQTVKELPIAGAGLAFDPSHDVLYVADPSADVIRAYDTASWTELFSMTIGSDLEDVNTTNGIGEMAVSDDSSIFLNTSSGVRWLRTSGAISTFGDAITFQADVSADESTSGAPGGSVSFIDTETNLILGQATLKNGRAILTLSNFHGGANSIFARYSGDSNYNAADSSAVPLNIQRAATTASLTYLDVSTATIKITSSAGVPVGGTASIWYDGKIIATAAVHNGAASLEHHLPLVVNDGMYLRYSGNSDFLPANNFVEFSLRNTSTTTISGPASAAVGSRIPIIARVRTADGAPIVSGTVTFTEGQEMIGSVPFFNGQAEISTYGLSGGLHSIIATFTGNSNYDVSVSTALKVNILPAAATLKLTASRDYAPKGQKLSFSATLSDKITVVPTGTIQLKEGKRILGTAGIEEGAASFDIRSLRVGTHSITATYLGDETFKPSSSAAVKVSVVSVTTVDLMIVYTAQARDADGDIVGTFSKSVSDTNLALWNSHIPVAIRLVYSGLVDYRESGKFHTDLQRLALPRDGFMDSIHKLRNTHGADLVSLFVHDGDLGGVSYELNDLHASDNDRFAFSVIWAPHAGSPDFFLAHELGHNLGATHDAQHGGGDGATSFADGWRFRAQGHLYHDIMSYPPGTTIPYFSNPRLKYKGVAIGAANADAARTITLAAATVAAYRKSK